MIARQRTSRGGMGTTLWFLALLSPPLGTPVGVLAVPAQQPARAARADNGPAVVPVRQIQGLERIQPHVQVELAFLRRCCELTDSQREAINAAVQAAVIKLAANDSARLPQRSGINFLLVRRAFQVHADEEIADPLRVLRQTIANAALPHLTQRQAEQFNQQLESRQSDEHVALMGQVLESLDDLLQLSPQQYESIQAKITERWNHFPSLQFSANRTQVLLPLKKEVILDRLLPQQQDLLRSTPYGTMIIGLRHEANLFSEVFWEASDDSTPPAADQESF